VQRTIAPSPTAISAPSALAAIALPAVSPTNPLIQWLGSNLVQAATQSIDGEPSMDKTVNLAIPFDLLLQAIASLSPADKQRLRQCLDADADASTGQAIPSTSQPLPPEQITLHQALKASGLVKSVRPLAAITQNTFQPVPIQGLALSQTILDERR